MEGPPTSMFSMASSKLTCGLATVSPERIEIDRHQVDRRDAVLGEGCGVFLHRAPGQQAGMDCGVQRLHPPVEHLGKPGDLIHRMHRHPGGPERRVSPTGGDDVPAECDQALGEGNDSTLVADRNQRAWHESSVTAGTPLAEKWEPGGRPPRRPVPRSEVTGAPLEHPRRERLRRCRPGAPARGPGPGSLRDRIPRPPGAPCTPKLRDAAVQHGLVDPEPVHAGPAEIRQQRRMNVDDPVSIGGDDFGRHQLQVPGQHDEVDLVLPQQAEPFVRVGGIGQHRDGEVRHPGLGQRAHSLPVADHQNDARAIKATEAPDERLEIAASTRDADGDPHRHGARS